MWPFKKKHPIETACEADSFPVLARAINNDRSNYDLAVKTLKAVGNISLLLKIQTLSVADDDLMRTLMGFDEKVPKSSPEINRVGKDGMAPIHLISTIPGIEICIRVLAHNRANLDVLDGQGNTPLLMASEEGLTETVQMLLNNGAREVDHPDKTGWTPLHYACQLANTGIVSMLMQAKAKVNPISKDGFMPIHVAISTMIASQHSPISPTGKSWDPQDALKCIQILVNCGADINYKCSQGFAAKDVLQFKQK